MSLYFEEAIEEQKENLVKDKIIFTFPFVIELPPLNEDEKYGSIKVSRRLITSYNFNAIKWHLRFTNDYFSVSTSQIFIWNASCSVSYNLYYDNDMRFELYSSSTISTMCEPNRTYFRTPAGFLARFKDECAKGTVAKVIVFVKFSLPLKNFNRPFDLPLRHLNKKHCDGYPESMENDYRFEFLKDSDYSIKCCDGSVPALRMVLNVSSELMKQHFKESKDAEFVVEHSVDVVKPIILYLHSLCFEMPKSYDLDFADRLYKAMDYFEPVQDNDLKKAIHLSLCEKLVKDHHDFDSLLQWLRFSIRHRLYSLWNMVCPLIANKFYTKWDQTFYRTPYHGNLTFLLLSISINHCATLILEIASKILESEIEWNDIYSFWEVSDFFTWAAAFSLSCLLCERIAASIWEKEYENMFTSLPWLGMILLILDWILSATFVFLTHFEYANPIILAVTVLLIDVIALIIFSFMPSITYKRYMHGQNTNFSLSQRYQMSENYRSSCLLTRVVWALAITTIFVSFLYIHKSLFSSFQFLFDLLYIVSFASQPIIYSILIFYYETKIHEFLLFKRRSNTDRIFTAKSIIGKSLVISNATEQSETYFRAYKEAWA